jgi:hypothetical protein
MSYINLSVNLRFSHVSSVTLPPLHSETLNFIIEPIKIQGKNWNKSSVFHTESITEYYITDQTLCKKV